RRRAGRARRPGRCAPGQRTTTEPEIIPRLNIRPKDIRRYLRFLRELVLEQIPGKTLSLIETILKITRQITSLLIPILVTIALGIVIYMAGFEDIFLRHSGVNAAHRWIFLLLAVLVTARF